MKFLLMFLILLSAAYQDVREGKISNVKIIVALCGICIFGCADGGVRGLLGVAVYVGGTVCFLFPLFLIHAIGAGDIKLFSLIAGAYGLPDALQVFIYWLLLAGIFSFGKLLLQNRLSQRMAYAWNYLVKKRFTHMPYYEKERDGVKDTIPLAPFLLAAYLVQALSVKAGIPF